MPTLTSIPPASHARISRAGDRSGSSTRRTPSGALRRDDIRAGDLVVVTTRNSVYRIRVCDRTTFRVSGGWFDRTGCAPLETTIEGCAPRGVLFDPDLLVAPGGSVRFGNDVVTSAIQTVHLYREEPEAGDHSA